MLHKAARKRALGGKNKNKVSLPDNTITRLVLRIAVVTVQQSERQDQDCRIRAIGCLHHL